MSARKQVQTVGEAFSVLVQTAELAQSKGILSFDDAIIVKSAIDFIADLSRNQPSTEDQIQSDEGPKA